MLTRELLCSNLEALYPRKTIETALYRAKRAFAEKAIWRLRARIMMDRYDFWLTLWLALPHDDKFIRHMPMREQLR